MLHSEKTFLVISGGDVENDKCEAKATMPLTEMNFSHIYPQGSICFAAAAFSSLFPKRYLQRS